MPRQLRIVVQAVLMLVGIAAPAAASEWWYVNSGPGRVVFVDSQSIQRRKDIVTYWAMTVIRTGEPDAMTKTHLKADCAKRRLGPLSGIRYDKQGEAIGTLSGRPGPMEPVPPDTLGDAQMRFACGDAGHRVTNNLFALSMDPVAFAEALLAQGGGGVVDAHDLHDRLTGKSRAPAPAPVEAEPVSAMPAPSQADPTEAARFQAACRGGDADACTSLGLAYKAGEGVPRDERQAAAAFAEACRVGTPTYCANIGLAYATGSGVDKDIARARTHLDAACRDANPGACTNLGASYSLDARAPRDQARARALFKQACDGDDAGGCYNLGVLYSQGIGVGPDPARAVALYRRACAADHPDACGNLANAVQSGRGVALDAPQAAELFAKACRLGNAEACLSLGHIYRAGAGVGRDPARAADYYRKALALEPDHAAARRALLDVDRR